MSSLITGLPGSGKTLFTLDRVNALAEKDGRPVYYFGIPDLKLPWIHLDDPLKWFTLPAGSIVVIDEAQKFFRLRAASAAVPEHVAAFETHRHLGIDVWLITQHPSLIDAHVRRLLTSHFHLVRKFGMHWSTAHEFYEVRDKPDQYRNGSVPSQFKYPEKLFSKYKSADLHTVKRNVPGRIIFMFVAPLVVLGAVYGAYKLSVGKAEEKTAEAKLKSGKGEGKKGESKSVSDKGGKVVSRDEYFESRAAFVPGLAYTAPIYQEVTKPKIAPAPLACVQNSKKCLCYTEQGTLLSDVPIDICSQIVANGFFVDWKEKDSPASGAATERERGRPSADAKGSEVVAVAGSSSHGVNSSQQQPPAIAATPESPERQPQVPIDSKWRHTNVPAKR